MSTCSINIDCPGQRSGYMIRVGAGLLEGAGRWARRSLGKGAQKIAVVSNQKVFGLYGAEVEQSLRSAGFEVHVWLMKDGEQYKNLRSVEQVLRVLGEKGITRTDAVVALGGGVAGDLAGFAAAIHLRGVPFLQIPTTLLSMIDSSVGGKTGVNSEAGKNTIGAFHQPGGVLIDIQTLRSLPQRELTAGFCEAIKQGAISGMDLLGQTRKLLEQMSLTGFSLQMDTPKFQKAFVDFVSAQIEFKASIVASDERESTKRKDPRSRKILNFGHTLAHALEKATDYRYFKHGEAVGYGILYAAELSKSLALVDEKVVNLLYDVVHRVGLLPPLDDLDPTEVFEAFRFDKKNVSGSLQMVLLKGIGKPVIVDSGDIPRSHHTGALKQLLKKYKKPA